MAFAALIVLDGWGLAEPGPGNAIATARTPVFDGLWNEYPTITLTACGRAVGLRARGRPARGANGQSEVGHLNLGAGSIVLQNLTRIDLAVEDGAEVRDHQLRQRRHGRTHRRD